MDKQKPIPFDQTDFDRLVGEITDPKAQVELERRYWQRKRDQHGPCASYDCASHSTRRTGTF